MTKYPTNTGKYNLDTFNEAPNALEDAYACLLNASAYQDAETCNLLLNLAPIVKSVKSVLEETELAH